MMATAKSNLKSKSIAISILLIVGLLIYTLLVEPYIYILDASTERLDSILFQYERSKRIIEKREYYNNKIAQFSSNVNVGEIFLVNNKPSLAGAEIQNILKNTARKSGVDLISSQSVDTDSALNGVIALKVRARSDIYGLQKFLFSLESGSPTLNISEISINQSSRSIFKFNNTQSKRQTLNFNMNVYGYIDQAN